MAGRHSAQPSTDDTPNGSRGRRLLPALVGVAVTVVLVGAAVASLGLLGKGPAEQPLTSATPGLVDDSAQQSPEPDRSVQRADRAEIRVAPSKTGSPSSSPSPSVKRSTSTTNTGTCKVSYYATGSTTANGESFDPDGLTAAHKTLPFNTRVRVTNRANGSSVVVRINDRGPFVEGRCLDLARGAFKSIASLSSGVISAKYEVLA